MKKLQFIDIGKPFRIIGKICKDIERAFRFKGINVNFIGMMIDYIGFAFILKWNLHLIKEGTTFTGSITGKTNSIEIRESSIHFLRAINSYCRPRNIG